MVIAQKLNHSSIAAIAPGKADQDRNSVHTKIRAVIIRTVKADINKDAIIRADITEIILTKIARAVTNRDVIIAVIIKTDHKTADITDNRAGTTDVRKMVVTTTAEDLIITDAL